MNNQLTLSQPAELVRHDAEMALSVQQVLGQVALIQQIMGTAMKDGEHYGRIPGCGDRPTLLKPGAEKLCLTFRMAPTYDVDERQLDDRGNREYRVTCSLTSILTGAKLGQGVGTCSNLEAKYRYRIGAAEVTDKPVPRSYWDLRGEDPAKAQELIGGKGFTVKKVDGKGWLIAKGGEKVENDNPADQWNTILKMGKKRALVDAVLTATAASDIFTQDLEDITANMAVHAGRPALSAEEVPPVSEPPKEDGTLTDDAVPKMYWAKKETAGPQAALDWLSESYNGRKVNVRKTDAGWRVVVFGSPPVDGTREAEAQSAKEIPPGEVRIHFGKNRGLMLSDLTRPQFQWYAEDWLAKKELNGATSEEDLALMKAVKAYGSILAGPTSQQKPQNAPGVSGQPEGETASWKGVICHLGIKGAKGMALGVLDERHLAEIRAKMAEKEKLRTRNFNAADKKLAAALAVQAKESGKPQSPPADDEPSPPWFTGPNHEKLSNLLGFENISEANFMATAHDQKWLPADVETFGMVPDDKAQQFCDNFADVIEGVRVHLEGRK